MPFFRKIKPIEARHFDPVGDPDGAREVMEWAGLEWAPSTIPGVPSLDAIVPTLEDGPEAQVRHYISAGYWVIKNPGGEFYGIRPDIMADTYEEVEPPTL
jgi:hypothetical protein